MKSKRTFAEIYCEQYGIQPEQYARSVFKRALYRRALPFAWFLPLFRRDYFSADFDFIYQVERLRRVRDFRTEAERFHEHPSNRGWLRHFFCIRVSTHRLKRLVKAALPPSSELRLDLDDGTAKPFATKPAEQKPDVLASAGL